LTPVKVELELGGWLWYIMETMKSHIMILVELKKSHIEF
jgi:hypothetical protein